MSDRTTTLGGPHLRDSFIVAKVGHFRGSENPSYVPNHSVDFTTMQRPKGVTVTVILMCITNAMGFFDINWQMPYAGVLLISFSIFITIGYAVLWFYWQGRTGRDG